MPKVGQKKPCTCGSGKKYKFCCGSPVSDEASMTKPTVKTIELATAPMLPGSMQHIVHGPTRDGVRSEYKIILTLSRPGFSLLPEGEFKQADLFKGDSHLAIAEPALSGPRAPV